MSAFTGSLRLYEDGALIATSTALSGATTYTFTGLANTLYYNGVLTVTAKSAIAAESISCASQTVACTPALDTGDHTDIGYHQRGTERDLLRE